MLHQPFADTPEPPYVAVIFTSTRTDGDHGYAEMAASMEALARRQPGFLGIESAREDIGITVSYWTDENAARGWKQVAQHLAAQRKGREVWYQDYRVRVAKVERDYTMSSSPRRFLERGNPVKPGDSRLRGNDDPAQRISKDSI